MSIHNDFSLSEVLWYKVGGKAKHFITAENKEDVLQALDFIEKNNPSRIFICGLGSNLIFSDDYFDGVVMRIATNNTNGLQIKNDGLVDVFAGDVLDDVIKASFDSNLTGLEWAGGLPGTVGAGVRGNVGAFGGEIKDNFVSVEVLELKGNTFDISTITKEQANFSYRNSLIKENKNLIVLSAKFQLHHADETHLEKAKEVYNANITYRKINHPIEYPTCGSVFKNIVDKKDVAKVLSMWPDIQELVDDKWHGKVSMGYVIKRLGFVGHRVGNMEVSKKHANFIMNLGGAKASNALTIISDIQEKVGETFGFTPEVEVEIVR